MLIEDRLEVIQVPLARKMMDGRDESRLVGIGPLGGHPPTKARKIIGVSIDAPVEESMVRGARQPARRVSSPFRSTRVERSSTRW
jgi:hypothetical protein